MGEGVRAHIQADAPDVCRPGEEGPLENCVRKVPGAAPLGELATTVDDQQVKRSENSKCDAQEKDFVGKLSGHSNHDSVYGPEERKEKTIAARDTLHFLFDRRLGSANRIAESPCLSSDSVRGNPVSLPGIVGVYG